METVYRRDAMEDAVRMRNRMSSRHCIVKSSRECTRPYKYSCRSFVCALTAAALSSIEVFALSEER